MEGTLTMALKERQFDEHKVLASLAFFGMLFITMW
jgi:hypothetical protein